MTSDTSPPVRPSASGLGNHQPPPIQATSAAATAAGEPQGHNQENTPACRALQMVRAHDCTSRQREAAAETLLRAYGAEILRHCSYLRLEDAEEVMQDAVMKFLDRRTVPADLSKPQAYFRKIYKNAAADRGRALRYEAQVFQQARRPHGDSDGIEEVDPYAHVPDEPNRCDPAERAAQRQLLQRVLAAVQDKPEDARLMQMFAKGDSTEVIARTLGTTLGAARDRIYRVRESLRALFPTCTK